MEAENKKLKIMLNKQWLPWLFYYDTKTYVTLKNC